MSRTLGQLTPVFVEKKTGDDLAPQIEQIYGGVTPNKELATYITTVGEALRHYSPRKAYDHKFQVLNDATVVNAFALGNGNIYVTMGLLNILGDEAELAAVMGHEIGHVAHRHIAHAIDMNVGSNLLVDLASDVFGGGNSERTEKLKKVGRGMMVNGFGRSRELEADEIGLRYAVSAGYDPKGSIRFFKRLRKLEGDKSSGKSDGLIPDLGQFLRSHPTADKRIGELEADILTKYPNASNRTNKEMYQRIVNGAQEDGSTGGKTPGGMSQTMQIVVPVVIVLALCGGIVILLHDPSKA